MTSASVVVAFSSTARIRKKNGTSFLLRTTLAVEVQFYVKREIRKRNEIPIRTQWNTRACPPWTL